MTVCVFSVILGYLVSLDENYRAKLLANGDGVMTDCINNPCGNGGSCISTGGKYICRCPPPFTGKCVKYFVMSCLEKSK